MARKEAEQGTRQEPRLVAEGAPVRPERPAPISAACPLVLASGSPRRSELLRQVGVPFVVRPVPVDEELRPGEGYRAAVERLSLAKAQAAWRPGEWVLAADTLVVVDGRVLGKPLDRPGAGRMLAALADREHEVVTGFMLLSPAGLPAESGRVHTRVAFAPLGPEAIAAYLDSGEPFGKAGAYAIQGIGAALVRHVVGSYTNVVGLPLYEVLLALVRSGALPGPPLAAGVPALDHAPERGPGSSA